jgi:RNA-binding protein YhbY
MANVQLLSRKVYIVLMPFLFMKQIKKLQIGKAGLTDAFVNQVRSIFERESMVKVSILKSACRDKKDAERIGNELVVALGDKFGFKLVGYVLTVVKFRKSQR